VISVNNLAKAFGEQVLFTDATFNINPREKVGLVGRNGHGKTTLLKMIQGEESPDSGEISIPHNYHLGYLEQHLEFTQPTVLHEGCRGLPRTSRHEQWRVKKILFGLGFSNDDLDRPPKELSGGFQVRLNLAKVLTAEPNLLLLDEPTNYLDLPSLRWLVQFLNNWKNELLLITHDRGFMDNVITHTLGIHRQTIRKIPGDTGKYYAQLAKEEEIYEKTRLNEEKKRRAVETFINRFRYKATLSSRVQSRVKALEKQRRMEKLSALDSLEFSFPYAPIPAKIIMEARNLAFSYHRRPPLLIENFSIQIGKKDRIAVIGKNGKGKSTLLKLLAGELPARKGNLRRHPRLAAGYFCQTNTARLDLTKTVVEEIISADPDRWEQQARNIAGALMFEGDQALKKISVLSGGEKSRVLLGKLLVSPSNLLLLDEPTNHLDIDACDTLLAALDTFAGAVVIVTHNEMYLHALANRVIVFDRKRIFIHEGSYQSFLENSGWQEDEGTEEVEKNNKNNTAFDRKTRRKKRAATVQRKSEILNPLAAKIQRLEKDISQLEVEKEDITKQMIDASSSGNGEKIAALAKRNTAVETELESLYEQLDLITREYEEMVCEFEQKINNQSQLP